MQRQGGLSAEKAILARERYITANIAVDWNRDGLYTHELSQIGDFVESVTTDRQLKGAAPEELLLIEGSSAAEMRLTLSGSYNGIALPALFSSYRKDSPFYGDRMVGAEVQYSLTVETPTGDVEYRQFVGFIRTITPNRQNGTVEITALDRAELMRKPVQLPPWAYSDEHAQAGKINAQFCYSEWVIDHCLRLCDIGHGPKRPTTRAELGVEDDSPNGVMFHLSGNWSILPTVGYLERMDLWSLPSASTPMWDTMGPKNPNAPAEAGKTGALHGMGLPIGHRYGRWSARGILLYLAADRDLIPPNGTHYLSMTLINSASVNPNQLFTIGQQTIMEVVIGWGYTIQIEINAGKIKTYLSLYNSSGNISSQVSSSSINIPTDSEFIDVVVNWDCTSQTGVRCSLLVGGHTGTVNSTNGWETKSYSVTNHSGTSIDYLNGEVLIGQAVNMCDIFYGVRNIYGSEPPHRVTDIYRQPKYVGVLDQGNNLFTYMPTSKAQEAWQLVTDVASAEFGAVFWDENGIFRFWNYDRIVAHSVTVVREYTTDEIENFSITESLDSVRNIYAVQRKRRRSGYSGQAYSAQDPFQFYVPAGTIRQFRVWVDNLIAPRTTPLRRYSGSEETDPPDSNGNTQWPIWDDRASHGFVVQFFWDTGSADPEPIWQELPSSTAATIDVRAYWTSLGYLTITVSNPFEADIRLASGKDDDSQGALRLGGYTIFDDDVQSVIETNSESIEEYGPFAMELSGDWWQYSGYSDDPIIEYMATRTAKPIPATDAITVAGDPRLQLADAIVIRDPDGLGDNMHYQILGISRVFDKDNGLTDTLTIEAVRSPEDVQTWYDTSAYYWSEVADKYENWQELAEG